MSVLQDCAGGEGTGNPASLRTPALNQSEAMSAFSVSSTQPTGKVC